MADYILETAEMAVILCILFRKNIAKIMLPKCWMPQTTSKVKDDFKFIN